jgi:hypothetical protein
MVICPHPLITVPHPLLRVSSPSSIFTLYRGPWQVRRPHGGVDLGRCTIVTTIRTVHFVAVAFPPLDPPLIQSLHTMQDLASTRRCRITDEGCLCLSRGVGERSVAGVDTNAYFSTQTSPSRLRPRRLIQHMGAWTNLADATTPCPHARV